MGLELSEALYAGLSKIDTPRLIEASKNAEAFNRPLDNWDTGEALNMAEMFYGATVFNQDLDAWNTSFVTTMQEMFREASSFNHSLNSWNVASVTTINTIGAESESTDLTFTVADEPIKAGDIQAGTITADRLNVTDLALDFTFICWP